jgi:DNA-binding NtrC family response regulator
MNKRVMVVDDDDSIRETFQYHLERAGYEVTTAATGEEGLGLLSEVEPGVVITDIRMPGMDGLELLGRIRKASPETDVLVITAHEDMKSASQAMREGAYDYLVKPLDLDRIEALVDRCFRDQRLRHRSEQLAEEAAEPFALDQLVGRDPRMIEIYKLIGTLADNPAPVLIQGETGTGKELIAQAIHFGSRRAEEPFIAVNCTALTETLLESELFGHVRGAFTGAVAHHKGRFEMAGAGTIFLDEIGDTSPSFQAKLLRVLEEREFYPVGGERPRRTEARVMAATNRRLEMLVKEGSFREDLYFRLKVVEITVPPLRERRGDIPLLAQHLLARIGRNLHKDVRIISDQAMTLLMNYAWPGNVRELENSLTQALVLARGPVVTPEVLSLGRGDEGRDPAAGTPTPMPRAAADQRLDTVERDHVAEVLRRVKGHKRRAVEILGISRPRLDRIIAKYGLEVTKRDPRGNDS